MDLFEAMTDAECSKFGDELMVLMAGRYAPLADWFKGSSGCSSPHRFGGGCTSLRHNVPVLSRWRGSFLTMPYFRH